MFEVWTMKQTFYPLHKQTIAQNYFYTSFPFGTQYLVVKPARVNAANSVFKNLKFLKFWNNFLDYTFIL